MEYISTGALLIAAAGYGVNKFLLKRYFNQVNPKYYYILKKPKIKLKKSFYKYFFKNKPILPTTCILVSHNNSLIDIYKKDNSESKSENLNKNLLKPFQLGYYSKERHLHELNVNFSNISNEILSNNHILESIMDPTLDLSSNKVIYLQGFYKKESFEHYDKHFLMFENILLENQINSLLLYNNNKNLVLKKKFEEKNEICKENKSYDIQRKITNFENRQENEEVGDYLWVFLQENDEINIYEIDLSENLKNRDFYVKCIGYLFKKRMKVLNHSEIFKDIFLEKKMNEKNVDIVGIIEFSGQSVNYINEIKILEENGLDRIVYNSQTEKQKNWFIKRFFKKICKIHSSLIKNEERSNNATYPFF